MREVGCHPSLLCLPVSVDLSWPKRSKNPLTWSLVVVQFDRRSQAMRMIIQQQRCVG